MIDQLLEELHDGFLPTSITFEHTEHECVSATVIGLDISIAQNTRRIDIHKDDMPDINRLITPISENGKLLTLDRAGILEVIRENKAVRTRVSGFITDVLYDIMTSSRIELGTQTAISSVLTDMTMAVMQDIAHALFFGGTFEYAIEDVIDNRIERMVL